MYVYMYARDPILDPIIGDRLVKPEDLLFYVIVSTRRSEQLHTHTHTHARQGNSRMLYSLYSLYSLLRGRFD